MGLCFAPNLHDNDYHSHLCQKRSKTLQIFSVALYGRLIRRSYISPLLHLAYNIYQIRSKTLQIFSVAMPSRISPRSYISSKALSFQSFYCHIHVSFRRFAHMSRDPSLGWFIWSRSSELSTPLALSSGVFGRKNTLN